MNRLNIWIIEDDPKFLVEAREALEKLTLQIPFELRIMISENWEKPPKLTVIERDGSVKEEANPLNSLPDILILDLFDDAMEFHGEKFYDWLREQEYDIQRQFASFVIIWSNYLGKRESRDFVAKHFKPGARFLALSNKVDSALAIAVRGCIERIEEEN